MPEEKKLIEKIQINLKKKFIKQPLLFLDQALEEKNVSKLKKLDSKNKDEKIYKKNEEKKHKNKEDLLYINNLKVKLKKNN